VSPNKEKVSREIRENKIAVCEKTQGLRSGNFSDLNSACSKVLVPRVKIFQFHHMHYESERYRDAANGLQSDPMHTSNRYITIFKVQIKLMHVMKTIHGKPISLNYFDIAEI
jgi:hypothetical protein